MKKYNQLITLQVFAITCTICLLSGCTKDSAVKTKEAYTYTLYSDFVYKAKADVLASINGNPAQSIDHAGKLYIKDNYIYLNEVKKGIHIIDNSNPSHPTQVAFLSIPGNNDIAIKGNTLYADMYTDMLALDISNPRQVTLTGKLDNFFVGNTYFTGGPNTNVSDSILVDWKQKDTTIFADHYPEYNGGGILLQNATPGVKSNSGTAGSMAGMVMIGNYLYAITEMHSLGIVDISNPAAPKLDSNFFAGFDLQTIFPFQDKLFLGSAIGMFIYDVSNPESPVKVGEFTHGRACDPVITDGSYAYVTLHAGDGCGGDENELDVINVKDLLNSQLVTTYPLTKPTGLSKDGNLLFICDGNAVKVYNASNPSKLILLNQIKSNEPYDIIAANHKAMVVTKDGLYQYDYNFISNIRLLSFMPAKK